MDAKDLLGTVYASALKLHIWKKNVGRKNKRRWNNVGDFKVQKLAGIERFMEALQILATSLLAVPPHLGRSDRE